METYSGLECHFTWKVEEIDTEGGDAETAYKHLSEDNNPDVEVLCMPLLAYLQCKIKDPEYESALKKIDDYLDKFEHQNTSEEGKDFRGFKYVAMSNKVHILWLCGRHKEADNLFKNIENVEDLPETSQASILGVRAYAMSVFGINNFEASLQLYTRAKKLDKKNYLWSFGVGYMSGRRRRQMEGVRSQATECEEESFKNACELTEWKKAMPIVFLADVLFSRAKDEQCTKVCMKSDAAKEAKRLYMKAYELAPNDHNILKRCGKAFSMMEMEELGEECLQKAVRLDPYSSASWHRLGQIYEFGKKIKNLRLAEKYYSQAVTAGRRRNFYAECDLSRIRKKQDITYNLKEHFETMKEFYADDASRLEIINKKIADINDYNENKRKMKQRNFGKRY